MREEGKVDPAVYITRNYPYATGSRCKQPQKPAQDRVCAKACFPLCGLRANRRGILRLFSHSGTLVERH